MQATTRRRAPESSEYNMQPRFAREIRVFFKSLPPPEGNFSEKQAAVGRLIKEGVSLLSTYVVDLEKTSRFYRCLPKTPLSWLASLDHSHCDSADPPTTALYALYATSSLDTEDP